MIITSHQTNENAAELIRIPFRIEVLQTPRKTCVTWIWFGRNHVPWATNPQRSHSWKLLTRSILHWFYLKFPFQRKAFIWPDPLILGVNYHRDKERKSVWNVGHQLALFLSPPGLCKSLPHLLNWTPIHCGAGTFPTSPTMWGLPR